jgi:hypothetical protein
MDGQRNHGRFSESPFRRLKGLHAPLNPVSPAGFQIIPGLTTIRERFIKPKIDVYETLKKLLRSKIFE